MLNGENLTALLARPTQQQFQAERTEKQNAERQREQTQQELQRRTTERDEARRDLQTTQQQLIQSQRERERERQRPKGIWAIGWWKR